MVNKRAHPRSSWLLVLLGAVWGPAHPAAGQESYTLDDLLRIGRERNPTILALRAEHAALEADRKASGRWANPELEFEAGTEDPFEAGKSRSLHGLSLRQPLENPIRRHYRLSALDRLTGAAEEGIRSGVLDVEFEIRSHYFRILYLRRILEEARLNAEALDEIRGLMETRARVGEVRELEALRLSVEHRRARNEVEALALELDQFRKHLNTFLGGILPEGYGISGELTTGDAPPELEALLEDALPNHPALLTAVREREAAEASMKATNLAWIPDPVVSGSSQRELDGDVRSFGIGFQVPLWNLSRSATERERQQVLARRERENAVRLELEAQMVIHLNRLRLARQTVVFFEEGLLEEAETSMEIAETSYREGEISFVEYLDARRTFRSIQVEYQQALYDLNLERAALERAAGGTRP